MQQTDRTGRDREGQEVIQVLRSTMHLLGEMAARYEVDLNPDRPDEVRNISSPKNVHDILGNEMSQLAQEQLRVLLLDTKHNVVGQRVIYQGNVNSSVTRPAEVFRPAIMESAPSIIIAHNHPSRDPTPSQEDVSITKELVEAGNLLGITLLDHVVIGGKGFVSMKERGLMEVEVKHR